MSDSRLTIAANDTRLALDTVLDVGREVETLLAEDPKFSLEILRALNTAAGALTFAAAQLRAVLDNLAAADRLENS